MIEELTLALACYLAVGGLILLVIYVHHRLTSLQRSDWVEAALRTSDPNRNTWTYRIKADFLAPSLAALFIWLFWPLALALAAYWKLAATREERESRSERESRESRADVELSELIERLSVQAIEALETVNDPLQAAPATPFGHLGARWVTFRANLQPEDELWSFAAVRTDEWGSKEHTRGYAIVRNGRVMAHFVNRRRKERT